MSESIDTSLVRIHTKAGGVAGAGFLVGERHILTCAHVIAQALGLADDTPGTIQRYKSAIESFLCWYSQEEHRPLTIELLTPITLVSYRNFLQRTQGRAT